MKQPRSEATLGVKRVEIRSSTTNEWGSSEMDHAYRAHTLRIFSVRSTVDETIQPFEKEQRMFALIRQLSRYILISG